MLDQTSLGHAFIVENFGLAALPRVGWQLDPFGHSAVQASHLGGALHVESS
jgi:alpha-mannosidase